ncbi:Translation factor GUF1, chloroplastic [Glycine max]|nr:Translation factor GUF1, chloroplastic [Glycine max]
MTSSPYALGDTRATMDETKDRDLARERIGIIEILNAIVARIPPPEDTSKKPLRALIFDRYTSFFSNFCCCVLSLMQVQRPLLYASSCYTIALSTEVLYGSAIAAMVCLYGRILSFTIFCDPPFITLDYFADEIGVLSPSQLQVEELYAGEVGYLSASIRTVADARVGDTVTHYGRKADNSLPGYEEATPMVSCGLFPVDADQFPDLCDALEKLQLNDAALKFEPETSSAMGFGFICGFLGLLHMEIVQERLEREYNLSLITTAPSVVYRVHCVNGDTVECSNPSLLPEPGKRKSIEEPFVKIEMLTPKDYIGSLMEVA